MDHKQNILNNLKVVRDQEKINKERFKIMAYNKAIKTVESFNGPITDASALKGLEGIGVKIFEKIEYIVQNGFLERTKDMMIDIEKKHAALDQLQNIMEVGPAKALELYEKHGICSIQDLLQKQDLLNEKQKMGLKYYDSFLKRIPRKEMEKHNAFILDSIAEIDPDITCMLAGSYRRGMPDSGDIDVLLCHDSGKYDVQSFKRIISMLQEKKYLVDLFANGDKKCMAVCKLPRFKQYRRIDLLYTEKKTFPFALLYFTGSQQFNVKMREYALKKGVSLNEYGFKSVKKNEKIDKTLLNEKQIFEFLGIEYVEPTEREDADVTPVSEVC